jgi:hypothetical protein
MYIYQMTSLYELDITSLIGKEYVPMLEDLMRFITIQICIQFMLYSTNPSNFKMFTADFFMLLLFIIVGVMFYWLIFRKLVSFK